LLFLDYFSSKIAYLKFCFVANAFVNM